MKAIVYLNYGPPEVAQLTTVPQPVPADNELLVKVYASTVNRTDAGFRSAEYFISRFWSGFFRPKYKILGCEYAGVVVAIGANVQQFNVGDKVFGFNDVHFGGHAEYLTVAETDAVLQMPPNISFDEAAALTEGAHYALVDIRAANVTAGQQVLLNGATGAIGSAALQLLKHFGAKVTAVCNTQNVDLIKSLGADVVIDYEKEDFTATETKFDFVFDAVGKSSFGQCKPLLKPKGVYISTELGKNAENVFLALLTAFSKGKRLLFPIPSISKSDLAFLSDLYVKGEFKPVIDRAYTMEQIVEAYTYVGLGHKTGNVILKINA